MLFTFLNDTLQGYLAWWAVRGLILYLDKKRPFGAKPSKRIALQLVSTTFIGLLIISLLTELTSRIVRGKPASPSFYTVDLFIISIWFFVINGVYIGLYYYNSWQATVAERQVPDRIKPEGLVGKQGKQDLLLSFDELLGLYIEGEYVFRRVPCRK